MKKKKTHLLQQFKELCLFAVFLLCFLACKDQKFETEKMLNDNGTSISLKAVSLKNFESGIAGGGHAPIFIPYAGFEKSWSVSVSPQGYDTLISESFENVGTALNPQQLSDTLNTISCSFSTDKTHLLYIRKQANSARQLIIHYFTDKQGFVTASSQFTNFNPLEPDWRLVPSTEEVAIQLIKSGSSDADLWEAVKQQEAENKIDYLSLEMFSKLPQARYHIEYRNADWKSRSETWKAKNRQMIGALFQQFEKEGKRDEILFYSLSGMIIRAGDQPLDELYLDFFFSQKDFSRLHKELNLFMNDPSRAERKEHCLSYAAKQIKKLLHTNSTENYLLGWELASNLQLKELENECTNKIISAWPADERLNNFIDNYAGELDPEPKTKLMKKAREKLFSKDSVHTFYILEQHLPCEEIMQINKKKPGKLRKRNECK